ncbi:OprD family porin [Pseudomonas lalucatii]
MLPHTLHLGLQQVSGDNGWLAVAGTSGSSLANDLFCCR